MTAPRPPRFALALLERIVPDSGSLAGDLVEEFGRRRSRAWVWWQVLAAMTIARFTRGDEIRPLRLVELQPVEAVQRSRRMSLRFAAVNLAASPLHGVGGLGLVALTLLMSAVMPGAWFVLLAALVAGAMLGLALIAWHRGHSAPVSR